MKANSIISAVEEGQGGGSLLQGYQPSPGARKKDHSTEV